MAGTAQHEARIDWRSATEPASEMMVVYGDYEPIRKSPSWPAPTWVGVNEADLFRVGKEDEYLYSSARNWIAWFNRSGSDMKV